jgi:hypothetical protein
VFEGTLKTTLVLQREELFGDIMQITDLSQLNCFHITSLEKAEKLFFFMKKLENCMLVFPFSNSHS